MTCLSDAFARFLERPGLSEFTHSKYHYRLRSFVDLHGQLTANDITTTMLLDHVNQQPQLADASKAILKSCFHAFLAFCGCEPNPAKALPRWRETPRRIIVPTDADVKRALDEAVTMSKSGEAAAVRDGLIFALSVVSGKTTAQRHGREHLSRIGRKGFKARAEKWFGSEAAYKEHLAKRCAYNYWKQSGRPMKYDVDGNPIWPDRYLGGFWPTRDMATCRTFESATRSLLLECAHV